jgi:predicted NAD/FAD-dependent oxidoreductase
MLMLDEDFARGHVGQWVFKRAAHPRQLSVVISDATDFLKQDRAPFVQAIASQIREQCAKHPLSTHEMPAVKHQRLIVEKRATFDAVPGLARPTNRSPWPRIVLAGDWTDTGYPAVLEGAVRSGLAAATVLEKELSL